jgi:hypothetical protein
MDAERSPPMKYNIILILTLIVTSCFCSEPAPVQATDDTSAIVVGVTPEKALELFGPGVNPATVIMIPLDGKTHVLMLHDEKMLEMENAVKGVLDTMERQGALNVKFICDPIHNYRQIPLWMIKGRKLATLSEYNTWKYGHFMNMTDEVRDDIIARKAALGTAWLAAIGYTPNHMNPHWMIKGRQLN